MVAVAVRIARFDRIFDHLSGETRLLTHDLEGLGFAHLAGQFLDLAVVVGDLDGIPGFEEVQTLPNARQLPNRRQIGRIERHAAKNRIQGVVPADDHFDGRADAGLLRHDAAVAQAVVGVVGTRGGRRSRIHQRGAAA